MAENKIKLKPSKKDPNQPDSNNTSRGFEKQKKKLESIAPIGLDGLRKLNDIIDKKASDRNSFKKLFDYIEGIYRYKVDNKIDNISKLIPGYPNPEILETFSTQFKVFSDLPDSCRKQILSALVPIRYKLQQRILKMDSELEKSINGSEDELDIETGMYMLCSGEVIILKNEK